MVVSFNKNRKLIVVPEKRDKKIYKGKVAFINLLKYKGDFYHHVCYKSPEAFTDTELFDSVQDLKQKCSANILDGTRLKGVKGLTTVGPNTLFRRRYPFDKGILNFAGRVHVYGKGSVTLMNRLNAVYFNYLNRLGEKKRDKLMKMQFRKMAAYKDFQRFISSKSLGGNWVKSYKRRMIMHSFLFDARLSTGYGHVNYLEGKGLVSKDAGYLSNRRMEVLKRFVRKVRGNRRYYGVVDPIRARNKWLEKAEHVSRYKKRVFRGKLLNLEYYNKALSYIKAYGVGGNMGGGKKLVVPAHVVKRSSVVSSIRKLGSIKKNLGIKGVKVTRRYYNKKTQRPKWTKAASKNRIGRRIIYGFLKEILNVRVTPAHVAVAMDVEEEVEVDEDVLKYRDMFIYVGDRKGDVNKIVGLLSRSGKKSLGLVHLRKAFFIVKEVLKEDPGKVVVKALDNIEPIVGVRGIKRGKKVVSIPYLLRVGTRRGMARRWLMEAAYGRDKEDLGVGLGLVLIDAYRNIGPAVNKKKMLHKSVSNGIPLLNLMR